MGIYNLEDGTINKFLYPSETLLVMPPPIWFIPNTSSVVHNKQSKRKRAIKKEEATELRGFSTLNRLLLGQSGCYFRGFSIFKLKKRERQWMTCYGIVRRCRNYGGGRLAYLFDAVRLEALALVSW
ncbi:hypothetical protein IFM89_035014 [Coptis chinensis]|uniref:Uncharacterized protein n=1 Tax=Coptis chinensis TaxID=261450 RepID=A0A835HPY2_9MAGN|nr:hypothetical protein IFM89_035014 [Coptis chinensis]